MEKASQGYNLDQKEIIKSGSSDAKLVSTVLY